MGPAQHLTIGTAKLRNPSAYTQILAKSKNNNDMAGGGPHDIAFEKKKKKSGKN